MKWPEGLRSATLACGIKKSGRPDLGVLYSERPMSWAGVFTRNAAAAAPVEWCRAHLGGAVRVLVVNSGNANACTGPGGVVAVDSTVTAAAETFGVAEDEVLVSSTGPIGVPLPVEKIITALPDVQESLADDAATFFEAIRTTDTKSKTASAPGVMGVAKGSAMVAPNMATMLAFIATDAPAPSEVLQEVLARAVDLTFNRISVDACESTNDSVFLFSTGTGEEMTDDELEASVTSVCSALADQIVGDAEGGTRIVRIRVTGARDEGAAVRLGHAVARSDLLRSALHGSDPNWGRVVSALGSEDRSLDVSGIEVSIAGEVLFTASGPCGDAGAARAAMEQPEYEIACSVGDGPGEAVVTTADLSPDYVKLNAFGMT